MTGPTSLIVNTSMTTPGRMPAIKCLISPKKIFNFFLNAILLWKEFSRQGVRDFFGGEGKFSRYLQKCALKIFKANFVILKLDLTC